MAQYAHFSTPDPELIAALPHLAAKFGPQPTDIAGFREQFEKNAVKVSFPESQLKVKDHKVPVEGGEIAVRSYVPQHATEQANPLLVWAHGGGFAAGGLYTDDASLQKLAIDLKISIVNVDYRLAPEHPFPTGVNDTYAALKWANLNSGQLAADTTKGFLLGGWSAGANMTAVLTHRAREDPEIRGKLTGQILQAPPVVHKDAVPEKYKNELLSFEQNKDAPILNKSLIQFFIDNYGNPDPTHPDMSPVHWSSHKDLPPALLQICGMDPLRDEGFLYEKLLKEDGVKTKLHIYPGLPHAFESLFPTFKQSLKWNEDLREGIKWLLGGCSD